MSFKHFEVVQGLALGNFTLGETMFTTMGKIGSETEVVFVNGDGVISVIHLPQFAINLIFDAKMQLLIMVQVDLSDSGHPKTPNMLTIGGEPIKKFDFKTIYDRVFGPTYPGEVDINGDYNLSYNGITFRFECLARVISHQGLDANQLIQNISTSCKEINCTSIIISSKTEEDVQWSETLGRLTRYLENDNPWEKRVAMSNYSAANATPIPKYTPPFIGKYPAISSPKSPISIGVSLVNIQEGLLQFNFLAHPLNFKRFKMTIGETQLHDVIKYFGPPCDSLKKKTNLKGSGDKLVLIHNYFNFGFDIFYHSGDGDAISYVEKVILHNNCIGSLEFMKYERLNVIFTPTLSANQPIKDEDYIYKPKDTNNFMKWNSIVKTLDLNIDKQPIFLNRKGYEINDDFTKIEIDEGNENGSNHLASEDVTKDLNDWALSKLVVTKNAIFEVLIKDNSLSNVTILRN